MINLNYIITNGYPTKETIDNIKKEGWSIVVIERATLVHPYAMENDSIVIYSKYTDYLPEQGQTLGDFNER